MSTLLLTRTMETKVTSKTSSLKALLLRAWRERWSDLQWGINIKTILPRGVSGDVYMLAECILEQALVGPGPNHLILSYLKHSLSSQLISYAAVLQRISKFDGFQKSHCIIYLLEFLETIQVGITCRGKPEEDLLAAAVLSIVHWLLQCYHYNLINLSQNTLLIGQTCVNDLIEKPAKILKQMMSSDFLCAMMYLAKHDDKKLYLSIIDKCQEIELYHKINGPKLSPIDESLKKIKNLDIDTIFNNINNNEMETITYCIQPLLAVQVLLNPSTEADVYANQFLMIKRLKNYTNSRLYTEIMRACLLSLYNSSGTFKESQWGAIVFLKVPPILKELHLQTLNNQDSDGGATSSSTSSSSASNATATNSVAVAGTGTGTGTTITTTTNDEKIIYPRELVDAFESLLALKPLLDTVDSTCLCNCVEGLLTELRRVDLIAEDFTKELSSRRDDAMKGFQDADLLKSQSSIMKVIIRAEPTLAGILKTLSAEYIKIQEALLSMLCQVLNGKSLDLMLAAATGQHPGKLKIFVSKLIKFNECSKQVSEPIPGKTAATRAMLFDISFLILCSIVQTYGSDTVLDDDGDSFFEQWVRECLPEKNKPKSPQQMLQNIDQTKVDSLLGQIISPEPDIKSSTVNWHIACQSTMGVVKELLFAWESGVLGAGDVKKSLDGLRQAACCLPVCATAWLCSHMSITHQDALLKPINMIQQLITPLTNEEIQDNNFKQDTSNLMFQIIRKMQHDVQIRTPSSLGLSNNIVSKQPILEQLQTIWDDIKQRGWVTIQSTQTLESLLNTGGTLWFVSNIVKQIFQYKCHEELGRAIDIAFSLFHLDIENCTLDLINNVIQKYLYNKLQGEELVEPQSSQLAKLCVYCILSTLEYHNINPVRHKNRKRTRRDLENEEIENLCGPANKLLRLNDTGDSHQMFGSSSPHSSQGPTNGHNKSIVLRDPLLTAVNKLLKSFNYLAGRDGEVSRQTHFILQFLTIMVQCGKDRTRVILQGIPQTLIPCLIKSLPELFTSDLILRLYDIQTTQGRKAMARDLCMLRNISLKPSN
ncbi:hypothetical protein HCN44_009748 [Aphidius gifuensis]|uniref:Mediator of RNA polymerase II transcription subunit 24 n=1 Tax=Aphidius gifuensis TaxID=684658 RepID=A0A834Y564_APHGI|nr:mediator of RNA polymerase II transcription subunit 24 [Aphidius gifuensis]KAF7998350.1 hypothetical protein HCN44_009748 [Aphidius gifuensis]